MSQGVLWPKIRLLGKKLWPLAREQTDRQRLPYEGFSLSSFCLCYERSNMIFRTISRDVSFRFSKLWRSTVLGPFFRVIYVCGQATGYTLWPSNPIFWTYDFQNNIPEVFFFRFSKLWCLTALGLFFGYFCRFSIVRTEYFYVFLQWKT